MSDVVHQHAYLEDRRAYDRNHLQVKRERGVARDLQCAECDQPARDWAHTHDTDPSDPVNYRPLCRKHHIAYDGSARKTDEHKAKITEARAHQVMSEAQLAALLVAAKRPKSPETRAKMSEAMRRVRAERGSRWSTKEA